MFQLMSICDKDKPFFVIKPYNDKPYVYIKDSKISAKSDTLTKNSEYEVDIRWWVHNGFVCTKYCLTKMKPICLLK